jgi:hypothetical protein
LLGGCQSTARKPPYSDNPLLLRRQPLVHTASQRERAAAGTLAKAPPVLEPPVPLGPPPTAFAQNRAADPPPPSWDLPSGPALPASPPEPPPLMTPLPARTMNDPPIAPAAIEMPAGGPIPASALAPISASRIINGKFGYAIDHSWLQGELDRHYRGFLDLRYRPSSEEDTFGGKVRLEDDPRLSGFRAGDIVAVEGELVAPADTATGQYPRYRIRNVRLIERK